MEDLRIKETKGGIVMKPNELSCKDLMVGDWVKIKTYGVSDKYERAESYIYVKVAEIGSSLITVGYNNDIKEPYRICENTEIEPISITPEILEKNRFIKSEEAPILMGGIGCAIIYGGYKRLDEDKFLNYGDNIYPIKYVHQLQHALRLCGIEKEIIL